MPTSIPRLATKVCCLCALQIDRGNKECIHSRYSLHEFLLVLDGLDEYDRDSIGKTQVATLMLDLIRSTRVNKLLSSSLEVPVENAFRGVPGMCLESPTSPDISAYIHSRL